MAILKLKPALKEAIWGGTNLKTKFNIKTDLETVAEAWVLSAHKDGESTILGGEYDGLTLTAALKEIGPPALGSRGEDFAYFPLLIKLIDARNKLSVQVHPDDEFALENEGEYGKTEMWYIVDCDEGAELYFGFKRDVSKEEFSQRIKDNTLTEVLNNVPVKKGDVFFIPSGTVHAIGAGIVIAEIQQNSNTTYRIFDYGRVGGDGKQRPLHIEKASMVSNLSKQTAAKQQEGNVLADCDYFKVRHLKVENGAEIFVDDKSFSVLLCIEGKVSVEGITLSKGECVFIPANSGSVIINGSAEIIESRV